MAVKTQTEKENKDHNNRKRKEAFFDDSLSCEPNEGNQATSMTMTENCMRSLSFFHLMASTQQRTVFIRRYLAPMSVDSRDAIESLHVPHFGRSTCSVLLT